MSVVFGSREVCMGPTVVIQGQDLDYPCCFFHFDDNNNNKKNVESSLSVSSGIEDDPTVKDEDEEIQSEFKGGALGSMESLVESLPLKRGLSNFFSGKSKSFRNLSEVNGLSDLVKQENPFNKRRRTLVACNKWARRSTFYSSINLASLPAIEEQHHSDADNADKIEKKQS